MLASGYSIARSASSEYFFGKPESDLAGLKLDAFFLLSGSASREPWPPASANGRAAI